MPHSHLGQGDYDTSDYVPTSQFFSPTNTTKQTQEHHKAKTGRAFRGPQSLNVTG